MSNKPAQIQGKRSAEFYAEHIRQVVNIAVSTDQVFKGALCKDSNPVPRTTARQEKQP